MPSAPPRAAYRMCRRADNGQTLAPHLRRRHRPPPLRPKTSARLPGPMTPLAVTDQLVFRTCRLRSGSGHRAADRRQTLRGSDDGELFLEYRESEQISLDDGRIRSAPASIPRWALACAPWRARRPASPTPANFRARVAARRRQRRGDSAGHSGIVAEPPRQTNARLYSDANPLDRRDFRCAPRAGRDRRLRPRQGPRVIR